jgi:hypothetical protein
MRMKPTFELTLVAQHREHDPDGNLRLRMALKLLLRTFGLRCTSVKNAAANNEQKEPRP